MKMKLSIIMPVRNARIYIEEAINSILVQTFSGFEFLILNDGSHDKTAEILDSFKDTRVRVFNHKIPLGVAASLNKLLKEAKGDYIARMDADDIASPQRLEKQVMFLDTHPQTGVVGSWAKLIDEKGDTMGYKKFPVSDRLIRRNLAYTNPFIHSTVMLRRQLTQYFGDYDVSLDGAEDYDLWCRLAQYTGFANINEVLMKYRVHRKNVSYTDFRRLNLAYTRVQIKKVRTYGYPQWQLVFGLKSVLTTLIPRQVHQIIFKRFSITTQ